MIYGFYPLSCVYCIHKPWQGERIKTHNSNKNYKASQKNEMFLLSGFNLVFM